MSLHPHLYMMSNIVAYVTHAGSMQNMLHPTFFLMPYVKQFYLSKTGFHAYIFGQRFSYEINFIFITN